MNIQLLNIENGIISRNTRRIVVRMYTSLEREDYVDHEMYVNADGYREWTEQRVAKHQLYELIEDEELDTSAYAWMDGIKLRTDNHAKEIEEIAACGSLEAYEATLPESRDAFEVETDYRLSMLELGL